MGRLFVGWMLDVVASMAITSREGKPCHTIRETKSERRSSYCD